MPEVFGLYVIMTNPVVGYETCAKAACDEGVRYLQLRMKKCPADEVRETAEKVREITKGTNTRFIVNDAPDIAVAVGADGVHLGQGDMPITEARKRFPLADMIVGLSTHNEAQAEDARTLSPSYIGVGPVFATPTKDVPDPTLGIARMGAIVKGSPLTTVAIGGITEENLPDVIAGGAINVSSVRPIMQSKTPHLVMRRLLRVWREAYDERKG